MPREEEPEDGDEFYYGLNRRNAEKQDAPFSGWATIILLCGLSLVPIFLLIPFLIPGSEFGLITFLVIILLIAFPILLVVILLTGSVTMSSLLHLIRQIFKPK